MCNVPDFNVLMNELETSDLMKSGLDVPLASSIINSLFFADDIVLIANSSETLETLLNITNTFAEGWNLKLNSDKSQVMVIGKRVSDKNWHIGNHVLKETNEYKYLGVFLSGR